MLPGKNRLADNDARRKAKSPGENLDESTEQEDPEENISSEKKCYIHSTAEQTFTGK